MTNLGMFPFWLKPEIEEGEKVSNVTYHGLFGCVHHHHACIHTGY